MELNDINNDLSAVSAGQAFRGAGGRCSWNQRANHKDSKSNTTIKDQLFQFRLRNAGARIPDARCV